MAKTTKKTTPAAGATKKKTAKAAKAPKAVRHELAKKIGKGEAILNLLKRPGGATMAELTAGTGWQKHSVRGYLSAVIGKKMGLEWTSAKNDAGERVYSLPA